LLNHTSARFNSVVAFADAGWFCFQLKTVIKYDYPITVSNEVCFKTVLNVLKLGFISCLIFDVFSFQCVVFKVQTGYNVYDKYNISHEDILLIYSPDCFTSHVNTDMSVLTWQLKQS
jgi:hypothetical protein